MSTLNECLFQHKKGHQGRFIITNANHPECAIVCAKHLSSIVSVWLTEAKLKGGNQSITIQEIIK